MSKFPLLNIYRTLAIIGAILLVIVGVITAIGSANVDAYYAGFNFGVFIATLIPFLGAAFGLGVAAEVIALLLEVVDHLEHIRSVTDRQAARESSTSASGTPPRASTPTPAYEPTVRVQAKTSTTVHSLPNHEAPGSTQLSAGQTLPIYGRTGDNAWLTISRQGTLWLDAADVNVIEGYLSNLPIVAPA